MNVGIQYMNLMFFDITKYNFFTENFKMVAVFKMAAEMAAKIYKLCLILQSIWSCITFNFRFVDIIKSEFTTKKFKMAAIFKMAAKIFIKIQKMS